MSVSTLQELVSTVFSFILVSWLSFSLVAFPKALTKKMRERKSDARYNTNEWKRLVNETNGLGIYLHQSIFFIGFHYSFPIFSFHNFSKYFLCLCLPNTRFLLQHKTFQVITSKKTAKEMKLEKLARTLGTWEMLWRKRQLYETRARPVGKDNVGFFLHIPFANLLSLIPFTRRFDPFHFPFQFPKVFSNY